MALKLDFELGGKKTHLNPRLVEQQKLNQSQVDGIIDLHQKKHQVFLQMEKTKDRKKLKALAEQVTQIEFNQQRLWGFPEDENFHYWWDVPQCSCPKMDNRERYGTKYRIHSSDCRVHSEE